MRHRVVCRAAVYQTPRDSENFHKAGEFAEMTQAYITILSTNCLIVSLHRWPGTLWTASEGRFLH